ncbi:Hypothetical predicted protein [Marmota monax]|uniref:Uncharacterized protein n=1 Tax=Marmota monax TaxID=9995 RepID=A0A5E4BAH3_MARMO|nr:hypothetical protein GHT09_006609 [Marmota monax]VTJ65879.1 Hypothetical predicted protein [Marmota monax]
MLPIAPRLPSFPSSPHFHSSFLSSSAPHRPVPASFSFPFLLPPFGLDSAGPGPRAGGICAASLRCRAEAAQEMRPPLAPGRGSRRVSFFLTVVARYAAPGAGDAQACSF